LQAKGDCYKVQYSDKSLSKNSIISATKHSKKKSANVGGLQ